MNTQSIYQPQFFNPTSTGPRGPVTALYLYAHLAAKGFTAVALCLVLLTGSIWAITEPEFTPYLQALNWSASFVFLAIAFDAQRSSIALMALATGIAVQIFTGLSAHFGPGFVLLGTPLMAAWLTMAIFRR
jgi:hypothetical protein